MKGDALPDKDHVSRYCGGSQLKPDNFPSGTAFRLKEKSGELEVFLSVNWLEYLQKTSRADAIKEIKEVLRKKFSRGIGITAKIAVLNIGQLQNHVFQNSEDKRKLKVLHEPELPHDPSHSGVHNLRLDDDVIADLIAQTVQEVYPAK